MNERNLQITFHLDGTGVYYDPNEPPMLDAIVACMRARFHVHGDPPGRDEPPFDIPLPFKKWNISGEWGWHASALMPAPDCDEQIIFWRKRFRQARIELSKGSPNLSNGTYRDWNAPVPLLMTPYLRAWCVYTADRKVSRFKRDLKNEVKWIGKKRAHGRGRVTGIDVEIIDVDKSCTLDGVSMRYLPDMDGLRNVRMRPPYWNNCAKTRSCEIGDKYAKKVK